MELREIDNPFQPGRPVVVNPASEWLERGAAELEMEDSEELREWIESEDVQRFFDEFREDFLQDEFEYPGCPEMDQYLAVVSYLHFRSMYTRRGTSHGMEHPDKSNWGMTEHWAWFAFQVWWHAKNSPTRCPWPYAYEEAAGVWAPHLFGVLEYCHLIWVSSLVAQENREEAEVSGRLPGPKSPVEVTEARDAPTP
jgi:hypothetical protein